MINPFISIIMDRWVLQSVPAINTFADIWNLLLNLTIGAIIAKYLYKSSALLYKLLKLVIEPMNYEQDMTIKKYCRDVAEINNNLVTRASPGDIEDLVEQELSAGDHDRGRSRMYSDQQIKFYPNGWLPVMESQKVGVGQIKRAMIIGCDVIVSRSLEGQISVLDAYCPHMGVHIGVSGQVIELDGESCVQCPFHGWTFRMTDGRCVDIPYMSKSGSTKTSKCDAIPKQAKLRAWTSCEVDNFIYIWHHVDGSPPNWYIDPTSELSSPDWVLAGRSCHISNVNPGDILENGADIHHFEGIHNDLYIFGCDLHSIRDYKHLQKYTKHCWEPDWRPILDEEGGMTHKATFHLDSWIKFFNFKIFYIQVRALQTGTANLTLRYLSKSYGPGILKMNAITLGGRRTMYVQHIYTKNNLFCTIMAKLVLYGEVKQLERDFIMWNHKKNLKKSVLVAEDKTIKRFRKWYSQFYKRRVRVTSINCV